jgi:hypothetical protein
MDSGEWRYSSIILSLNTHGGKWSASCPGRCSCYSVSCGSRPYTGWCGKVSLLSLQPHQYIPATPVPWMRKCHKLCALNTKVQHEMVTRLANSEWCTVSQFYSHHSDKLPYKKMNFYRMHHSSRFQLASF